VVNVLTWEEASAVLRDGGVIALPTDTVYGLAASVNDPDAVAQLFALKQRPTHVSLPVLVADEAAAVALSSAWPEAATALAARWWPGALTMIVPASDEVARRVHAQGSVGVRVPNDPDLRALIQAAGPLCVTSANQHGEEPCADPASVQRAFAGTALAGVVNGALRNLAVSTVVDLTAGCDIVREGAISRAEILETLGH
jgi:L-threonylcarbamoyladenylate synthase